jgi:hypothetical protein
MWTGFIWLRIVTHVSSCEHGKEPFDSIKGEVLLTVKATVSFLRTLLCVVRTEESWCGCC